MRKSLRNVVASAVVAGLVLVSGASFATAADSANINLDKDGQGSITIHKRSLESGDNPVVNPDGKEANTVPGRPLNGAKFKIRKLKFYPNEGRTAASGDEVSIKTNVGLKKAAKLKVESLYNPNTRQLIDGIFDGDALPGGGSREGNR